MYCILAVSTKVIFKYIYIQGNGVFLVFPKVNVLRDFIYCAKRNK